MPRNAWKYPRLRPSLDRIRRVKHAPEGHLPPPLTLADRLALAIATGLGAGYSPVASGTAGTLVAIPLYWALAQLPAWQLLLSTVAFIAIAVWAADRAGAYYGASDDGHIVSDEIAGYLITMALVAPTPKALIAGFLFFRLFDIVKPWPASWFDKRMHNGLGNVMDDVAAAVYARIGVGLLVWLWP